MQQEDGEGMMWCLVSEGLDVSGLIAAEETRPLKFFDIKAANKRKRILSATHMKLGPAETR